MVQIGSTWHKRIRITKNGIQRWEEMMENLVNLPGVRQWAKYNEIISRRTGESASFVIIRVAIRAWASMFKVFRIYRWTTRVRRRERLTTTKLRSIKSLTRASTCHAPSTTTTMCYSQLWRTRPVQIHQTPRRRATSSPPTFSHYQHRNVIPINQTHVVKIKPIGSVQSELRQSSWWLSAAADTLHFTRPTVAG